MRIISIEKKKEEYVPVKTRQENESLALHIAVTDPRCHGNTVHTHIAGRQVNESSY